MFLRRWLCRVEAQHGQMERKRRGGGGLAGRGRVDGIGIGTAVLLPFAGAFCGHHAFRCFWSIDLLASFADGLCSIPGLACLLVYLFLAWLLVSFVISTQIKGQDGLSFVILIPTPWIVSLFHEHGPAKSW